MENKNRHHRNRCKKTKLGDFFVYKQVQKQSIPECEILVNNQKRKLYGKNKSKVYLNDGDYIQLRFFNPLYERFGVQLEFNGEKEEKILVLNPGQNVIIDRFIDTKKKIRFSTYLVEGDNKRVKEAIKNNGNLIIHFWSEKKVFQTFTTTDYNSRVYSGSSYNESYNTYNMNGMGRLGHFTNINSANQLWEPIYHNDGGTSGCNGTSGSSGSSGIDGKSLIETGRIEKGEKSKQKMKEVEFKPEFIFYKKEFKLLPYSVKEAKKKILDTSELAVLYNNSKKPKSVTFDDYSNYRNTNQRVYCSDSRCGYRIRNNSWRYCPMCSTPID